MDIFKQFENELDTEIKQLEILNKPLRAILLLLNIAVSSCCTNENLNPKIKKTCNCDSVSSMFSYLLELFSNANALITGSTSTDILSIMEEEDHKEINYLIQYARFCEIAPYLWRNVYKYSLDKDTLKIEHNDGHMHNEIKDTILTVLASPPRIVFDHPPKGKKFEPVKPRALEIKHILDQMSLDIYDSEVRTNIVQSKYNPEMLVDFIFKYKQLYKQYWFNNPMLSEEIYNTVGITENDFIEFTTFWLALANYYIEISQSIMRYIKANGEEEIINNEYLEYISPFLKKDQVFSFFGGMEIIGITEEKFHNLMNIFSCKVTDLSKYGDGYFPVFFEFKNAYLFSPYTIRSKLSPRNMLYILLKTQQQKFDNEISQYLEPNLIKHATLLFKKLPNTIIKTNETWYAGEFDILVYLPDHNIVFHIQAKGTMPPEGARMTKRLESRMKEGVEQLTRFQQIDQNQKDIVVSKIFETDIQDITLIDVLLGWGGFGTKEIWDLIHKNTIAPLNLSVLHSYIDKYTKEKLDIINFVHDVNSVIDDIVDATNPQLSEGVINIRKKKIIFPSLVYSDLNLTKFKYIVN